MLQDRKEALVRHIKRWDADCLKPLKKIPEFGPALKQQTWDKAAPIRILTGAVLEP